MNAKLNVVITSAFVALSSVLSFISPVFAEEAYGASDAPQVVCPINGNNNQVVCIIEAGAMSGDGYDWAPTCVTPIGNYRARERQPYHTGCWVPLGLGGVAGWTGDPDDNFFFPLF